MRHTVRTKKGLDLPITGAPTAIAPELTTVHQVAVLGEYPGLRPSMQVDLGDKVKRGQTLFLDKKNPGVHYTAPGAGKVIAINRGAKRVLQSVVIALDEEENCVSFDVSEIPQSMTAENIAHILQTSGLWTALRVRPFGKVPTIDSKPDALFVNCMDSNPLGMDMNLIVQQPSNNKHFQLGLTLLAKLHACPMFVCTHPNAQLTCSVTQAKVVSFAGPHPAGLVGTHIHHLFPVSRHRQVWHIAMQDVIAIGALFNTGVLEPERIIALAGPLVAQPRHVKTRLGAAVDELITQDVTAETPFVISGSPLSGHHADAAYAFLGRYHQQISVIEDDQKRRFMGWLSPGFDGFSTLGIYVSRFLKPKHFRFTNTTNGSERAMVPMSNFEQLVPMDILPTQLLRALLVGDLDTAEQLGALELEEEDLGLCTFACPGKYEYGPVLRSVLDKIEAEG